MNKKHTINSLYDDDPKTKKYIGPVGPEEESDLELYREIEWHYRDWETDRKSTRLNSSHSRASRMPSSA